MTRDELLAAYQTGKRDFRGACLVSANLDGANLRGANLCAADLGAANLYSANLTGAHLRGACLYSADLRGAHLRDADLTGAYLRDADLTGAYLRDANLRGANLGDANLHSANLDGADLRGACLYGADLRNADLGDQWIIQGSTRSDGYNFDLTNLRAEGVRLKAGCRNFTMPEAYEHWTKTRSGTPLGNETLAILDNLWELAFHRGYLDQDGKWINEHKRED